MEQNRAERVIDLLNHALSLDAVERASFVQSIRAEDEKMAAELVSLLSAEEATPAGLDALAARLLPDVLDNVARSLLEDDLQPDQAFDHYRILDRLAGGGMAEVYRARDLSLGRLVVLKLLPAHLTTDDEARARMLREARAASALDHPNIAVVFAVGTTPAEAGRVFGGRLFIAMAYYAGETIKDKVARAPLAIKEALGYAIQAADGLAVAHEAGIVHRDIKPANLIITERQQLKILDFGIAKLVGHDVTTEGSTLGTIAYMSPEQTRGERVDARSDMWSLGVVLYEMLTGRRPFPADDGAALLQAIRQDCPPPLRRLRSDVPERLERIVDRCLCKDPAERYSSASALRDDLVSVAHGSAQSLIDPLRDRRRLQAMARTLRRQPLLVLGLTLVFFGIAALVSLRAPFTRAAADSFASMILVLPMQPPPNDTALARLGRDLAVTLSATLDGMGEVRTIDASTLFAHLADSVEASIPVDRGTDLARRLGAGSILLGSLIRDGSGVRADARLVRAGGTATLARATAVAAREELGALTDSLTILLTRELWRHGDMPVPSLGAVTTRSPAALRAYVEGEQALASGDMSRAVDQFEHAFAADSTFWFSYWRALYPRVFEGSRPDSAVMAAVFRHRRELPERDRLLIEARLATTVTARANALRALTDRYSTYWPAAFDLANQLVHSAPFVGSRIVDARAALERVVALNPRFAMAWHHLFWITAFEGDIERSRTALESIERLADPAEPFWEASLIQFRTVLEAMERGGEVAPEHESEMAALMMRVANQIPELVWGFGAGLTPMGFAAAQIRINQRVLAMQPLQPHAANLHMATAMAWASRGAWDSVDVELNRWVRLSTDRRDALRAYGLGVLGVALGGWGPERAASLRPLAANAADAGDSHDRAELAWLDGMFAVARSDTLSIGEARGRVRRSGAAHAASLDSSLYAFQLAASGDEMGGARTLERVELGAGERWAAWDHAGRHPYLFAMNRFHAARWLLAAGDTSGATRLLEWYHGVPGTRESFRDTFATFTVLPFVFTELARIAEARGRTEEATAYRLRIVRSFDAPSSREGRALLAEATAALARAGGRR